MGRFLNCNDHTNAIGYTITNTFSLLSKLFKPCDLISPCLDAFFMQCCCRIGGNDTRVFALDCADVGGGLLLPSTPQALTPCCLSPPQPQLLPPMTFFSCIIRRLSSLSNTVHDILCRHSPIFMLSGEHQNPSLPE